MKNALAIIVILTFSGCSNEQLPLSTDLNGKWVDIDTRSDTLTFGLFGGVEAMVLGRGREMGNGFLVPKSGTGPYHYTLLPNDTIALRWTLSSNSDFNEYYFRQTGYQLVIDKFFGEKTPGTKLVFKKIY